MPRALLLINPASGRGRALESVRDIRRLARTAGVPVAFTRDSADVARRSATAIRRGVDRVIVAGGDGTAHHAIRALHGTDCVLGIIPVGSGNDLARALGLPREVSRAFDVALHGSPRRIDLGVVNGIPFAGAASVGIDGEANRYANTAAPWLRGTLLYAYAGIRTFAAFEPFGVIMTASSANFSGSVMLAVVSNSGRYGGGMRVAPSAVMDDGRLDVVVIQAVPRRVLFARFLMFTRGRHMSHPKVRAFTTQGTLISTDRRLAVYCDGEAVMFAGETPIRIEVAPSSLSVAALPPKTG